MSNKRSNAEQRQPQLNHIFLAMHSQGGRARKQSKELAKKKKKLVGYWFWLKGMA